MASSRKSGLDCKDYAHIEYIYNLCNDYNEINKTDIKIFMHNFNFSNTNIRNEIKLKEKIINYLLKNNKNFLKGKKSFTKQKINKEVKHYLDLALQFLVKKEDLQHLILIYFSSMEKDILLNTTII